MAASDEQVRLCLSLLAYAGSTGEAARSNAALAERIEAWLGRVEATADLELCWGPASFRVWWQPSTPALVAFVVRPAGASRCTVVLRGGAPLSLWDHHIESLACLEQEPWVWAREAGNLAPAVCSGVYKQLAALREMTPADGIAGAGQTLPEFLSERVTEADSKPGQRFLVDVTGHGIGGTLATAFTLWLLDSQGSLSVRDDSWDPGRLASLRCTAFAGPTAGNPDFATYLDERLGAKLELIHNRLDHAPVLWDSQAMAELPDLYAPHVEDPAVVRALIEALGNEIDRHGIEYEQAPATILDGRLNTELPRTFVAQAEYQHLHAYAELLGLGPEVDVDAILERRSGTDDGPIAQ